MERNSSERNLSDYYKDYLNLPFEPHQEKFRKNNILRFLDFNVDVSAIEIGCGRESIFSLWSPKGNGQIVEPVKFFIDLAMAGIDSQESHNIEAFEGNLNDFINSSNETLFDVTILSSILHEIEHTDLFLSQAKSITKPGGKIIIVVPNKLSVHRILGVQLGYQGSLDSKTETEIQMQQLTGALSFEELQNQIFRNGLILESMESFFVKLFPHKIMQQLMDRNILNEDLLDIFDQLSQYLPGLGSEIIAVAKVPK